MDESRFSWTEAVLLLAIAAMIVVIARPGIVRGRRAVNEEEAIAALRTLATVEVSYHNRHPSVGYTCSLEELLKERLIDRELGTGTRAGYRLSASGCRAPEPPAAKGKKPVAGAIVEYQWFADPVDAESGTRHFCIDQTKTLRASDIYSGQSCLTLGSEP